MGRLKETRRKTIYVTVCTAVLCCFFIANGIINFVGYPYFSNGDMYADQCVATQMWEQKTLFPENWVYGNQFYVLATPVVTAAFYGITADMNLSLALATTLMSALIVISFWWMLRPFAKPHHILFGLTVLVGIVCRKDVVTTYEGQLFFSMASYYAIYLITLFVVFGDYARGLENKSLRWPALLMSGVLCFVTGMQSLRQTVVMILPLLAFEALRLLCILIRTKKLPKRDDLVPTLRVAAYTATNLLGYLYMQILNPAQVTIYGELSLNSLQQILLSVKTAFKCILAIVGIDPEHGARGPLAYILPPMLILMVAFVLFRFVLFRKKSVKGTSLLLVLCVISMLSVITASLFVRLFLREIYLFMWYPMVAIAAVILLEKLKGWKNTVYFSMIVSVLAVNLYFGYADNVKTSLVDAPSTAREIAQYVVDEDYEIIYGNWTIAPDVAVWSNGELTCGVWRYPGWVLGHINLLDIYTEEDNSRAVYMVMEQEKDKFLQRAAEISANVKLLRSFEDGTFLIYTSDRQLMYTP